MSICNVIVGNDRVLIVQDAGTFDPEPPHRRTGTGAKIAVLPERRLLSGGCGNTGVTSEWRRLHSLGVAGDTVAAAATYGPGLLRSLWDVAAGPTAIVVAGLDDAGMAACLLMQSGRAFRAEKIPRGRVLLIPDTAERAAAPPKDPTEKPTAPPKEAAERKGAPEPDDATPPDIDADWPWLRWRLITGTRLQIAQRRVPFAPPFTSALLHPDGCDLREFRP